MLPGEGGRQHDEREQIKLQIQKLAKIGEVVETQRVDAEPGVEMHLAEIGDEVEGVKGEAGEGEGEDRRHRHLRLRAPPANEGDEAAAERPAQNIAQPFRHMRALFQRLGPDFRDDKNAAEKSEGKPDQSVAITRRVEPEESEGNPGGKGIDQRIHRIDEVNASEVGQDEGGQCQRHQQQPEGQGADQARGPADRGKGGLRSNKHEFSQQDRGFAGAGCRPLHLSRGEVTKR